jgi:acetylornithine deacetylase/succinyl-diaminopimelate desuccinylase-like protein
MAGVSDARRRAWVEAARGHLDRDRLRDLAVDVVSIPSPTGDELGVARYAAGVLAATGAAGRVQHLDDRQANAVGRLRGTGEGPSLLLYAPVDTLTTGTDADLGVVGPVLRDDMRPAARVAGDLVTGLGAGNPKGHAACVLAAVEALAAAVSSDGLQLAGDLHAGLGAGGMPTNGPVLPGDTRRHVGHGVGCAFLLEQGVRPDHAVVAKPGWTVSWEEVGLAWFDLTVSGTHTYVGSRHKLPYRNAIAAAGVVAGHAERWFEEYAAAHTDGLVAPQGVVAAVEGGWRRLAAVTPATCTLRIDLRLSPRTSPQQAAREVAAFVDRVRTAEPDLEIEWDLVLAVPGGTTDPASWVVRSAVAAWEEAEGRPHADVPGMSGATDANILRAAGVPTARIGMPKVPGEPSRDFALGMNTVDVREMERLTRALIRVAVDTCTRTWDEIETAEVAAA